jgi:predicted nucleic acid-binding protein
MSVAEEGTTYFLDTSAVVKLYHQEQGSEVVEAWAADLAVPLWLSELTRAEFHSVFVRKVREGQLTEADLQRVVACFHDDLQQRFQLVPFGGDMIEKAITLLLEHGKRHPLRTLDALQIVSAQVIKSDEVTFATADKKLFTAAAELFTHTVNPEVMNEDSESLR